MRYCAQAEALTFPTPDPYDNDLLTFQLASIEGPSQGGGRRDVRHPVEQHLNLVL